MESPRDLGNLTLNIHSKTVNSGANKILGVTGGDEHWSWVLGRGGGNKKKCQWGRLMKKRKKSNEDKIEGGGLKKL